MLPVNYGYFQQVVGCLLPLRDLYVYICVYVYVASSGYYTLGMIVAVLCAEGPRDAIEHVQCQRRLRAW